MEKIEKVWFEENKIFIETNKNKKYSIPLEVFPTLKDASAEERSDFYIWDEAQSIRWECLDEDIHISSFFKEHKLNPQNPVAKLFSEFPQLNVAEVANMIGIHKNLLAIHLWCKNTQRQNDARYQRCITPYRQKTPSDTITKLFFLSIEF